MNTEIKALLDKVARLEQAANRGLQINQVFTPSLEKGSVISAEFCKSTLQSCALFRKWINECFGSDGLSAVQTCHNSEQRPQSPLPQSR